jgi:hypothetical protein
MEDVVRASHERFRRRLAKLIEISNEMVLNAADGEFGRSGGQIFYVFDESAFEFFINPDETRRKYPAFFHLEPWRDTDRREDPYWILVNQMLSILTAEYLFSGILPGQRDNRIYMTYGHRYELGRSYQTLLESVEPKSGEAAATRAQLRRALARLREVPENDDAPDVQLESDLHGVPESDRVSFLRVRRLARIFAEERDQFRIPQLRRVSQEIWPHVRDITYVFPPTEADRATIDEEAKQWEQRLNEYLRTRPRGEQHDRNERGLRRDARTLAMLQHIARYHLDVDERLVFVTGDRVMLEVYWFWYSETFVHRPWEPNIIRSIGRFSPVVNMNDMLHPYPKDEMRSDHPDLAPFELMQVALNLAIQPWKLKAHESLVNPDPQRVANLWWLRRQILDSIHRPHIFKDGLFDNVATPGHFDDVDPEFEKVRDLFQMLERNASRAGLEFQEQRREKVLSLHDRDPDDAGDEASARSYFRNLTSDLVQENARLWLPIAQGFLAGRPTDRPDPFLRAPVALLLKVGHGHDGTVHENVLDFERRLATVSPKDLEYLEGAPHLIFVLGALYALRNRLWSDTELYAGLAKTAFRSTRAGEGQTVREMPDYQELRYLRAVCARMVLGSLSQQQTEDSERGQVRPHDIWLPYLNRLERNLGNCIEVHRSENQPVQHARALSERGSGRLFYVTRRAVGPARLGSIDVVSLGDRFAQAVNDDLMPAFGLLRHGGSPAPPDLLAIWRSTMRQVLVNAAAVDTLGARLTEVVPNLAELRILMTPALEYAEEWLPGQPASEFPFVVRQELSDFLTRRGASIPEMWRVSGIPSLAIDREILSLLARPAVV